MNKGVEQNSGTEQVVGYDARDYRDDFESLWPPQRREQFLYRLDVKKVLSVDARVWPSVSAELGQSARPDQAAMQNLWASLRDLQQVLSIAAPKLISIASRTVAITFVDDGTRRLHPTLEQVATLVDPNKISRDWQFVGYDVADAWLLSALSNCGFLPGYDDVEKLRKEWAPHLNGFHLFDNLKTASAFRQMSDQRLASDHAPTFVYGIRILSSQVWPLRHQ
jgi:hypothetical protein